MLFGSKKNKPSNDTSEAKNLAENESIKKDTSTTKAKEKPPKLSIFNRKKDSKNVDKSIVEDIKQSNKSRKQDRKIQQEKSQLAKDLNIRISSPYGYYPEDVDPIILDLQKTVSDLTKENKQLSDTVGDLTKKNADLSKQFSQLKLQMSIAEIPISLDDNLTNISKGLGNITGNNNYSNEDIPTLSNMLQDDDDYTINEEDNLLNDVIDLQKPEIESKTESKPKPKLKLKSKPKIKVN